MNNILVATLGGLSALVLWGISDWLTGKASKKYEASVVNLTVQISGVSLMALFWAISGEPIPNMNQLFILILTSVFFTVAYLSFIKSLSTGEAGIIVPLANTYPLITIVLTAIFLSLPFDALQILSMLAIIMGAILLGTERLNWMKTKNHLTKETILAFGAALFWGLGFFTVNSVVDQLAWEPVLGVISIAMGFFALLIYVSKPRNNKRLRDVLDNRVGLVAGITLTFGSIAFYFASEVSGNVLIPAVIAAASPLVTSLLGAIFDKERIILSKRVGAVLVVIGVTLLNFV